MQVKTLDSNHRLYMLLVIAAVFLNMLNGGMAVLTEPNSWSSKVATITAFGEVLGYAFMLAAAAMVPLLLALVHDGGTRKLYKLAVAGAVLGSLDAVGMAYMSRHLDIGWFSMYYLLSGFFSLAVAGVLSKILNSNLARLRSDYGRA